MSNVVMNACLALSTLLISDAQRCVTAHLTCLIPAQPAVYMGFHAGMATAAVCTAVIWFHSYWAHTIFLAAVLLMAAYNGATYYFKIFANR